MRDEDAAKFTDYEFMREQDRIRKLLIGNCRLMDVKNEKNGNFELAPKVSRSQRVFSMLTLLFLFVERRQVLRMRCAKRRSQRRAGVDCQVHFQASTG